MKHIHANTDTKKKIIHRLKIANGHLSKVISMIEEDAYCVDVIHQSQAVQKAISQADILLLENHLKHCVSEKIKSGEADNAIQEIVAVFEKKK